MRNFRDILKDFPEERQKIIREITEKLKREITHQQDEKDLHRINDEGPVPIKGGEE